MAGKICVYIRDTQQPADLYDSSSHWYAVSIHEVGSNNPLHWKGINYSWVWLPFMGEIQRVAGEFEVPAGTYLVKGYAFCQNVVTHIAWVQVNDGETASVNLVTTATQFCLWAAQVGVALGTARLQGRDIPIIEIAPAEAEAFMTAATKLTAKLPKEAGIAPMTIEDLRRRFRETPKD